MLAVVAVVVAATPGALMGRLAVRGSKADSMVAAAAVAVALLLLLVLSQPEMAAPVAKGPLLLPTLC